MKYVKWAGLVLVIILVVVGAGYGYASYAAGQKLSRTETTHEVDIPVPWPLTEEEIAEIDDPDADLDAVAMERARQRGEHLVRSRYACSECHGEDFGGGVMVDDPAIGRLLGPNLTTGKGTVVDGYTVSDWDRIVRHGVTRRGTPAVMPSEDFLSMSDQELSDIIAFLQSRPPVDNEVAPVELGPLGTVLVATGRFRLSATLVEDHQAAHKRLPPQAEPTAEFGRHIAQVCTGCHGATFRGGPIAAGPPDWPPAKNLTPHEDGLADWSFEEFDVLMRTGKKRDGSEVLAPMNTIAPFAANMTETEMRALFSFLQSLPPEPTGK